MQSIALSQNTAAKALYNIPPFKDNEFEVWLGAVGNAFHGAGIPPLLRITNFRSDVEAPHDIRQTALALPGVAHWISLVGNHQNNRLGHCSLRQNPVHSNR